MENSKEDKPGKPTKYPSRDYAAKQNILRKNLITLLDKHKKKPGKDLTK